MDQLWERHFADSLALIDHLPKPDHTLRLLDMGSGAGFPGLVIAMTTGARVDLVESHGRKCAFLRQVRAATGAPVRVHQRRLEDATLITVLRRDGWLAVNRSEMSYDGKISNPPSHTDEQPSLNEIDQAYHDVITARALAPLDRLLHLAEPFFGPNTLGLFPKGANVDQEIHQAEKNWCISYHMLSLSRSAFSCPVAFPKPETATFRGQTTSISNAFRPCLTSSDSDSQAIAITAMQRRNQPINGPL